MERGGVGREEGSGERRGREREDRRERGQESEEKL